MSFHIPIRTISYLPILLLLTLSISIVPPCISSPTPTPTTSPSTTQIPTTTPTTTLPPSLSTASLYCNSYISLFWSCATISGFIWPITAPVAATCICHDKEITSSIVIGTLFDDYLVGCAPYADYIGYGEDVSQLFGFCVRFAGATVPSSTKHSMTLPPSQPATLTSTSTSTSTSTTSTSSPPPTNKKASTRLKLGLGLSLGLVLLLIILLALYIYIWKIIPWSKRREQQNSSRPPRPVRIQSGGGGSSGSGGGIGIGIGGGGGGGMPLGRVDYGSTSMNGNGRWEEDQMRIENT